MLTRLRVSGFKNLVNVDVRFGPFTCIAGANGVGKSNLFDAISFLSALADYPLLDAALSIRVGGTQLSDVRSLFHRVGNVFVDEMSFEVEMVVPHHGVDDLGQEAQASITFLRYALTLAYRKDDSLRSMGNIEIVKEELAHIKRGDAYKHLLFPHKAATWRKTAIQGERRVPFFISTEGNGVNRVIKLHQDGGSSGKSLSLSAITLPRTVLSAANSADSPTTLLARREMQSWRVLQLEPSALRTSDDFTAPTRLGSDGSHLAATLYHLVHFNEGRRLDSISFDDNGVDTKLYAQIAGRLSELINDVRDVWIDRDERRELLTLYVTNRDGTPHSARALSDGTLRFLALAVLELDPEAKGLLCLEEPENGIHPAPIPAMLDLLQGIATDVEEPIDADNPLRQVIINTHSPAVVQQVPDDSLLFAELKEAFTEGRRFKRVNFSYLPNTWREAKSPEGEKVQVVSRGKLLAYLNPVISSDPKAHRNGNGKDNGRKGTIPSRQEIKRVVDRPDIRQLLFDLGEPE